MRALLALAIVATVPLPIPGQSEASYDAFLRQVVLTRTGGYGHPTGISYQAADSTTMRLLGSNDSLRVTQPNASSPIDCPSATSDRGRWTGGYLVKVSDSANAEAGVRRITVELSCTSHVVIRNEKPTRFWELGVWDVIHDASGWRVLRQISRRMT
ncbi:MAG: hypothetical protein IPP98_07650 [Gemmatimonadetes bacterium]|nr:hypothetical protein [Gemmatimonadota bacterium]